MASIIEDLRKTKERLAEVSPSFCLAKWYQVTIHLQNGQTQSCHHPDTHKISLNEIEKDPSALHNTSIKKDVRLQMLKGEFPTECGYCWQIETTSPELFSDRHIKSNDPWSQPYLNEAKSLPWNVSVSPTYVEVSFSNLCNFKCAYCFPHISSRWMEEVKTHGPYPLSYPYQSLNELERVGKMPLPLSKPNPYVEAFWKWWPELHQSLKVFRITGGEPLLSTNTFKLLDYLTAHPSPNLELGINSNLGVPKKVITRFINRLDVLLRGDHLKEVVIYTSIDTWGKQAAYIRHGLNHDEFWENVEDVLGSLKNVKLVFMCTFNALSVAQFSKLLEKVLSLKETYGLDRSSSDNRVILDISFLKNPVFQSVKVLPPEFTKMVLTALHFMRLNSVGKGKLFGYTDYEIEKLNRIYQWMQRPESLVWVNNQRADFFRFFSEHDRRRNTNFLDSFPEMESFWKLCEKLARYSKLSPVQSL